MKSDRNSNETPFCPSAQPEMADSVVFGVVAGTVEEPRVRYLAEPLPVTEKLLSLTGPVKPTEVFRFAAPCAGRGCQHFNGNICGLVARIVALVPPVVNELPPCQLRLKCRWWKEEGGAACGRCPLVVTENYRPTEPLRLAADPKAG
jgi:hypothetical protein